MAPQPSAAVRAADPTPPEPSRAEPAGGAQSAHGTARNQPEPEHHESVGAVVARLLNFALLAGALVYLLRSPFRAYLEKRSVAIRSDLAQAARTREEAAAQLRHIDEKLTGLPDELEAIKRRGAEEIAAEEARIRETAAAERQRALDVARREIESQLRVAERELRHRAGELAVDVATARVKRTITDADQERLVDRYLAQVRQ